jgi:hypothetical protein
MKWFDGCKTIAEAEKLHKKLAMKYHPDKGGSTEIMQEINNEYGEFIEMMHTFGGIAETVENKPVKRKVKIKVSAKTEEKMRRGAGTFAESLSDLVMDNISSRFFERI